MMMQPNNKQELDNAGNVPEWLRTYNPEAEQENDFGFIGKLVANGFQPSGPEYNEKAHLAEPVWQWRMEYEALDVDRDDGTPGIFSTTVNLESVGKDGTKRRRTGNDTPPGVISTAFSGLGITISPALGGTDFVGHVFRMVAHNVKQGSFSKRVYIPVEYFGDNYVYTGKKRVLKARTQEGESVSARNIIAQAAANAAQSDVEKAQRLITLIDGLPMDATVLSQAIGRNGVRTESIYGINVVVGLRSPKFELLDKLEQNGLINTQGGIIHATTPVSA